MAFCKTTFTGEHFKLVKHSQNYKYDQPYTIWFHGNQPSAQFCAPNIQFISLLIVILCFSFVCSISFFFLQFLFNGTIPKKEMSKRKLPVKTLFFSWLQSVLKTTALFAHFLEKDNVVHCIFTLNRWISLNVNKIPLLLLNNQSAISGLNLNPFCRNCNHESRPFKP